MSLHSALHTPLCEMLGIEIPIVQAGMGYVARAELAAAVSAAGALGVIGAASLNAAQLRAEIRKLRDLTDRPFGVDVLFATVGRPQTSDAAARFARDVEEQLEVVFTENVPVLASGLGDPGPIVAQAHAQGMTVIALVGNTKNALRVARSGVDLIVAQGYDGGGHTGRIGTLSLLPAVLDVVGGLCRGRWHGDGCGLPPCSRWRRRRRPGTRFVASREAFGHDA
jgi:enoyl-[acyl-carrier protein] reductase II